MTPVNKPMFFGVGIGYALVFLALSLATREWVNAYLLVGLMVGFISGHFIHKGGRPIVAVQVGVGSMILYQSVLLYLYREVPNIGIVWFVAGPAIVARIGRPVDILIWTPVSLVATIVSYFYVAQYPIMQHPMSLPNLVGVLTLSAIVSYFFVSEKQERETQLMESLDAAKQAEQRSTRFLASLSHELRTPMTSILLSSEVLRESRALSDEDRAAIERLYASASLTTGVLNDVLELAKVEANLDSLSRQPFRIEDLLFQLKATLMPLADEYNCRLYFLVPPNCPGSWVSNLASLRQVIGNIASNAIKHSRHKQVCLIIEVHDDFLDFLVRDTGEGIAPDLQETIFEPFVSMADATALGTGLGLTLARGYARLIDAKVDLIFSEPKQGSVFRLRVPKSEYRVGTLASKYDFSAMRGTRYCIVNGDTSQQQWITYWCDVYGLQRHDENSELVLDLAKIRNLLELKQAFEAVLGKSVLEVIENPDTASLTDHLEAFETDATNLVNTSQNNVDKNKLGHILVCDDNELIREVFSATLESFGYDVAAVADSQATFALLAQRSFDFVILDVQLEHESGVDLLKSLRSSGEAFADIPVCMISGSLTGKEEAQRVGADHYLLKPPSKADLEAMAERMSLLSELRAARVTKNTP